MADFSFHLPEKIQGLVENKLIEKTSGKQWVYEIRLDGEPEELPNLSLLLEKFIPETKIKRERAENKGKFLFAIENFSEKLGSLGLLDIYKKRIENRLKLLKKLGYLSHIQKYTTRCRVIVGLGSGSVLETSITLHRIYGFPYIPGSALKGLTRNYAIWKLANDINEKKIDKQVKKIDESLREGKKPDDFPDWPSELQKKFYMYQSIFGNQKNRGRVIFFDAFPDKFSRLEVDIMNPHYADYYRPGSTTPPADYLTPSPIPFLTVAEGQVFLCPVAFDVKMAKGLSVEDIVKETENLIKQALQNFGIGAKTAVGYGYFDLTGP